MQAVLKSYIANIRLQNPDCQIFFKIFFLLAGGLIVFALPG
jgi:hypothetical protein